MESACLRIKFTPLMKDIQKEDSKHFLEIVPEVSCIQNLDKIQWRKQENSIEYTIPMTYKIILRKKEIIKDNLEDVDTLDKIYHSCVDLLLPSSDSNLMKLGSGDINRIVSDTFVLSKVTADVESCNILLKEINNANKIDDSIELAIAQVQTEVNSNPSITSQLVYNEVIDYYKTRETTATQTSAEVLQSESLVQVSDDDIFDSIKRSIDKITNTENIKDIGTFNTEAHVLKINSKTETTRKLSLTPICSINTNDEQTRSVTRRSNNTIVFRVYESQNIFRGGEFDDKNYLSNDFYHDVSNKHRDPICISPKVYDCICSHRILPEVRVANFVQIMEKEIMPLKRMLVDIIHKCSSLGFTRKKTQNNSFMYKSIPITEKPISRCLKTKKQSKSNRVVYSIVFDG